MFNSIFDYWSSMDIETRGKLKVIISIIVYGTIYFLFPLDIEPIPTLIVQLLFSLISAGILIALYFVPVYLLKRLGLLLGSRLVALFYLFLSLRIVKIERSMVSLRINTTIFSLLSIPIILLLSIRSINRFLIEREDCRLRAIILRQIGENQKAIPLWKLKSLINNLPTDLLSNNYKVILRQNFQKLISELREKEFINGFYAISLTEKGKSLSNYFSFS